MILRRLHSYNDPATGAAVATTIEGTATRAIVVGVSTGVLVWLTTRVLDRIFFGRK